jgi:hypothetical protein
MMSAATERVREETRRRDEEVRRGVAALEARPAELEKENALSPVPLRWLGGHLGFGVARELERVRFKLRLMALPRIP